MYQITMEVPEETIVNGRSKVITFKSEPINMERLLHGTESEA